MRICRTGALPSSACSSRSRSAIARAISAVPRYSTLRPSYETRAAALSRCAFSASRRASSSVTVAMSACHVAAVDHLPRRRTDHGHPRRRRLVLISLHRSDQRFLYPSPVALLEPVEPVDRRRGTGIHSAVEGLVAPARLLLPGAAREALYDAGHQALGGELLEVLLAILREVARPRREGRPGLERLARRPLELEPAVQLAFGDGRADRPDAKATPPAAGIGLGDREQQRRVLVPPPDRHRGARLPRRRAGRAPARLRVLPHPGVHVLGGIAGVDAHHPDRQRVTARVWPVPRKYRVQHHPGVGPRCIAFDHPVVD